MAGGLPPGCLIVSFRLLYRCREQPGGGAIITSGRRGNNLQRSETLDMFCSVCCSEKMRFRCKLTRDTPFDTDTEEARCLFKKLAFGLVGPRPNFFSFWIYNL